LENCCGIPVAGGRPTPVVLEFVVTIGKEVVARSACGATAVACGDATPADRAGEVRDRFRVVLAAGTGVAAFVLTAGIGDAAFLACLGDDFVLAAFLVVVGVVGAALLVGDLRGEATAGRVGGIATADAAGAFGSAMVGRSPNLRPDGESAGGGVAGAPAPSPRLFTNQSGIPRRGSCPSVGFLPEGPIDPFPSIQSASR
jgi:hypothetical protein